MAKSIRLADMVGEVAAPAVASGARAAKPKAAPKAKTAPKSPKAKTTTPRTTPTPRAAPAAPLSEPVPADGPPNWTAGRVPPVRPEPVYRRPRRRLADSAPGDTPERTEKAPAKWQQLAKPKAYLAWPKAAAELDALALTLDRLRPPGVGERITANTLLRLASGWLLEVGAPYLMGVTEAEMAASLGLAHYPAGPDHA